LSIGFQSVEAERRTTARGGQGVYYKRILLLELSSVVLPACQDCLVTQRCAQHGGEETAILELADDLPGLAYRPRRNPVVIEIDNDDDYLVLDVGGRRQTLTRRELERIVDARIANAVKGAAARAMAQARRRQRP
jgi:hypothetical protein